MQWIINEFPYACFSYDLVSLTKGNNFSNLNRLTSQFIMSNLMTPKPDIREERKEQILDAAMTVFAQKGFHQARMDDIVEQSGLSKGTIYWYFKSKHEIISTIMGKIFEAEFKSLQELLEEDSSAVSKINKFINMAQYDVENMLLQTPLTYEFISSASREPEIRLTLQKYLRNYIELMNAIIQQGVDSGEFRPVEAEDAAIALGAIFEGIILLWVYDPEFVDLYHHMQTSIEILLKGLCTEAGSGV